MLQNGHGDVPNLNLGHICMDFFNNSEDPVWQIDAATGETEKKSSIKFRSIQLAKCLRNAGLKPGDVITVSGVNHLDVHIPFYACYFNGHPVAGIDNSYKYVEIKRLFDIVKPKLAFCDLANVEDFSRVVTDLKLDTKIVTFCGGENSFANFIKTHDDATPHKDFKVATYDTDKVYAWLVITSGTAGLPKVAAFKHSEIIKVLKINSVIREKEPVPFLYLTSVQWISSCVATLAMIASNYIKLQTSQPPSIGHIIDIINKYKPIAFITSPLLIRLILENDKFCDLTCFRRIIITASAMKPAIRQKLKARMRPEGVLWNLLGQTECIGGILLPAPEGPENNIGKELPHNLVPVQLVDTTTGAVIKEPNKTGELWTKGPRLTEYYNNPEATAEAFSPDGWFKTGDLLYRDQNGYYFFVERISSAFRSGNFFVTPMEMEAVIADHPDVVDVCVVGLPHPEDGKHPVACVQRRPGSNLTEQEVKDLVASNLSEHKQLRGGVIFVDDFPRTFSQKIARGKVLEFVMEVRGSFDSELPSSGNTKKLISAFQQLSATGTGNVRYLSTGRR